MRWIDAAAIARTLDYPGLIEQLRSAFRGAAVLPERHHHHLRVPGGEDATLLLMPAWREGGLLGVKVLTVHPSNARRGLASTLGTYLAMDAASGEPLAAMDATELTRWRTAAASALAAGYLARRDSRRLLVVGTGALAPHLARAYAAAFALDAIRVWGRDAARAEALADRLRGSGLPVQAARDLEQAVRAADIVGCATLAREPLVRGAWLRPGAHLDLVGGFTPRMREADDEAVRRATVYVDTPTAIREAGDIVQPLASGALRESQIAGDLFGLCRGEIAGRANDGEITLFKSAGTALEDLACAELVLRRLEAPGA